MIKEYRDIIFESAAVNKLNKDIKNNPEVNFKIVGYNVIPQKFGPDCTTPESEVNTDTDPEVSEFVSKRFNFPDDH